MIPVYYTRKQSTSQQEGFSPSASKPRKLIQAWKRAGIPIQIIEPRPATLDDFALAHDRDWVRRVLSAELPNGFGTRSIEVAQTLPYTTGAIVDATLMAAQRKIAVAALVSGMHHAGFDFNGAFCSTNGIIVAAQKVRLSGEAKRVGILDLDQHDSDGCRNIIERLDLGFISLYSFGAHYIVPENAEEWLAALPDIIRSMNADVIIAQLGADPFEKDPLSSSRLTIDQLRRRDRVVFETCRELNIGCSWALAGGYTKPFTTVIEIHTNSLLESARAAQMGGGKRGNR